MRKRPSKKRVLSNSLFFRTFLSAFLVLFIVLFSILLIYINNIRGKMLTEYRTLIQTSVSSIDQSFSQNMRDTTNLTYHLFSTVQGTKARLQKNYSAFDLARFSADIRDMYQILPNIHSVTVLTKDNEEALTVTNPLMGFYTDDFGGRIADALAENDGSGMPFIYKTSRLYRESESYTLLNIHFRNTGLDSSFYSGTVIVSVDTKALSEYLFDTKKPDPVFYILNQNGDVIAHNTTSCCGENWSDRDYIADILQGRISSGKVTDGNRTFEIYVARSSLSGYYIVAESDYTVNLFENRNMFSPVLITVFLLGVFSIAVLYFLLKKLFRPLDMAVEEIKTSPMFQSDGSELDDVALLSDMSKRSGKMIEELKEKDNRNIIVKAILKNEKVDHLLYEQNYLYKNGEHLIVLVHIGREQEMDARMTSYESYRSELAAALTEKLGIFGQVVSFEFGFRRLMLVISSKVHGTLSVEAVNEALQSFSGAADASDGWQGTFYVSGLFDRETEDTCTGIFVRGESAIKTRRKLEPEYQKIVICESGEAERIKAAAEALTDAARHGDKEEYLKTVGHLISAARSMTWESFSALIVKVSRTVTKVRYPEKRTEEVENRTLKMLSRLDGREALVNWLSSCYEDDSMGFQTVDNNSPMPVLERAVAYIENHYQDNNLNLNYLAGELHISAPYLGKIFHEFTGATFNDYLLKKRMERAGALLKAKRDASVTSIAKETGYSNSAYFATSFRNYFGMTPTQYRDQEENGGEDGNSSNTVQIQGKEE